MYQYKTGFAPGEGFATHARRRYRLLPPRVPNPEIPNPNPSLWLLHYSQAEPQDRIQSNMIPADMRIQQILQTRAFLHQQGQIVKRDFMLHDQANWPQIQMPRMQARQQPMYAGNMQQPRVPQGMAYPPQAAPPSHGPPAPKRQRTAQVANVAGPPQNAEALADDDEDISRGDLFDQITPREISLARYKQNHDWLDEVLNSPYAISQILPVDLGLGLAGELSSLTDGIFDAPTGIVRKQGEHNYVGKLDGDKAEEFRKRVQEHVAQNNAEVENMKARHAKKMAKFKKNSLVTLAEKELRNAVNDPTETGPEFWRLEGRVDEEEEGEEAKPVEIHSKVDDIVAQVEASLGRHAAAVQELRRIQDGGLEERAPTPEPPAVPSVAESNGDNGALGGDAEMDMGGSAAGLLDQYHTGFSSTSTPNNNFPTPQAHFGANSSTGTPSNLNVASPQPVPSATPSAPQTTEPQTEIAQSESMDIDMAGASTEAAADSGAGTGDWVVVPPGGVSPPGTTANTMPETAAPIQPEVPAAPAPTPSLPSESAQPPVAAPAPMAHVDSQPTPQPEGQTPSFADGVTDFGSLSAELDTAGDALAGFEGADTVEGEFDLGMEGSAFGDAFHGVDAEGEGGI
jgi:hypothetical protein